MMKLIKDQKEQLAKEVQDKLENAKVRLFELLSSSEHSYCQIHL